MKDTRPNKIVLFLQGVISVVGGITGALIGGILINRLDLKFPGLMRQSIISTFLAIFACGIFFAVCPTVDFAGVTVGYENRYVPAIVFEIGHLSFRYKHILIQDSVLKKEGHN